MRLEESRAGILRLPSAIPGFDQIAFGGLPEGRTALVAGSAGAGKTIFGVQFLVGGALDHGQNGVLVTFEERPEDLIRNVESFGWALDDLVAAGQIAIVDATPDWDGHEQEVGDFDLDGLVARILAAQQRSGAERVTLDSIGSLLERYGSRPFVRQALIQLIGELDRLGTTTVLTIERADGQDAGDGIAIEEFVADTVILLRNPLEGERRRRTLEILKLRGGKHRNGEFPFTIDATHGLSVVPLSAIELEKDASDEEASTGNVGLDEMLGGGVYRDSVLLVSGATGTGKTSLVCEFMRPVVDAGERGILVTLEESRSQILRNARNLGVDLAGAEASGRLDVITVYPGRLSLEDLLLALVRAIESRRPDRVTIDSLTALERFATERSFHEFAVGLITLLKQREILSLFTVTSNSITGDDAVSEAYVSTMSDGIVLLRYLEAGGEIDRGIAVLKMRGTAHDSSIRRYTISSQGLRIEDSLGELAGSYLGGAAVAHRRSGI